MSTQLHTALSVSALVFLAGCTFMAPRIEVAGTPGDLERLSGEWRGEYIGDRDHGRRGTIVFKLVAGENHAHGDVVMIPEGRTQPYQRYQGDEQRAPAQEVAQRSRVLEIRFVNALDDTVSGVLEPYWDPDRRTRASATFRGQLKHNTIEGAFTTTYANGDADTGGRWHVRRTK